MSHPSHLTTDKLVKDGIELGPAAYAIDNAIDGTAYRDRPPIWRTARGF